VKKAVRLSPREAEIALLIAAERSDKAIAAKVRVSMNTLRTHLRRIARKLGVEKTGVSRRAAIRSFVRRRNSPLKRVTTFGDYRNEEKSLIVKA
jgi:DNA-binding CsgD family transcriptional regulator